MNAVYEEKNPTILVLFGATGDLTREKIIPALFRLHTKKLLPALFQVVGFSRRELPSEEFQEIVRGIVSKKFRGKKTEVDSFVKLFTYVPGFFEERKGYRKLAEFLGFRDNEWRVCSNKLFYLAVPPAYYKNIFEHLAVSKLTLPCSPEEGWTRVVVEKPFGKNSRTAEELDALLGKLFKEEQIYRIDHYLGKETVQNILAFRFSNPFFEPAWDNRTIESITVHFYESEGVGNRVGFYEGVGALRDVGQNHVLQLLALFTMENPGKFDADSIRSKRAALLSSLRILSRDEIEKKTIRGQYRGYLKEKGVRPNSRTETYFRIEAAINAPRWGGVSMILEGGKKLNDAQEVVIRFRHPVLCLCPVSRKEHFHNELRYRIQPKESISASFLVKKPGEKIELEEKDFVLNYEPAKDSESFLDAYERLLLGVVRGDQTLFVSTEEILSSWKFIDPITAQWKRNLPQLVTYAPYKDPARMVARQQSQFKKELLIVGLGKMGKNMALRLAEIGWKVRGFDANAGTGKELAGEGIKVFKNLKEAVRNISAPRVVWLMVPSRAAEGEKSPVDEVLFGEEGLAKILKKGDIIVDGGNSHYTETIRRARLLAQQGIAMVDAGVSGGPSGARRGAAIMVGGNPEVIKLLEPLFQALAVPGGYAHVGKSGAGHFIKMVHNGIEYGMMQAIAEGFATIRKADPKMDVKKIAALYNRGTVIESRLMGWLHSAFEAYGKELEGVRGSIGHLGEGEWTVEAAKKLGIPVPVIEAALQFRIESAKKPSYTGKIVSALRNQFGGHSVKKSKSQISKSK